MRGHPSGRKEHRGCRWALPGCICKILEETLSLFLMKGQTQFRLFYKKLKFRTATFIQLPYGLNRPFKLRRAGTLAAIDFTGVKNYSNGTGSNIKEKYGLNHEAMVVLEHLKKIDPVFAEIFLRRTFSRMDTTAICERYDMCPSMFWDIMGKVRQELITSIEKTEETCPGCS